MMDLIVIGRDAVYRLKPSSPPHVLSFAGVGAGSFYLCQKLNNKLCDFSCFRLLALLCLA